MAEPSRVAAAARWARKWARAPRFPPTGCSCGTASASRKAADQAGYLAALGVTHVYLSPILQANPGSPHGYDVVDHSRVSTDLGGEPAFREMAHEFHRHGLGVIVDVVPNHMARPTPESAQPATVVRALPGPAIGVRALVRRRLGRAGGQAADAHPGRAARGVPGRSHHRHGPEEPGERRAPRAGAALFRPRASAPGRCRRPAPRRAARPAALPAHRLAATRPPSSTGGGSSMSTSSSRSGSRIPTCSPPPTRCCCACCARG